MTFIKIVYLICDVYIWTIIVGFIFMCVKRRQYIITLFARKKDFLYVYRIGHGYTIAMVEIDYTYDPQTLKADGGNMYKLNGHYVEVSDDLLGLGKIGGLSECCVRFRRGEIDRLVAWGDNVTIPKMELQFCEMCRYALLIVVPVYFVLYTYGGKIWTFISQLTS